MSTKIKSKLLRSSDYQAINKRVDETFPKDQHCTKYMVKEAINRFFYEQSDDQKLMREIKARMDRREEKYLQLCKDLDIDPHKESESTISGILTKLKELEVYSEASNETLPFISESFLYEAIGKDDARTVLAWISELDRMAKVQ